ncbi:MAG TPA: ATP-binding protein [Thermoanaerobaculia bacterium]|jgi:PAS domain S-box-containing protein|nr:ATP-binding protein [Thermoanaerobaculia bacterium]
MGARQVSLRTTADFFLVLVCLLVLLPCLYYPYKGIHPDLGFTLSLTDWKVATAPPCEGDPDACLKVGDHLISVEGVSLQQFIRDRGLSIPGLFGSDGVARIQLIRDGELQAHDIRVRAKRLNLAQMFFTMVAPLVFWLMGTVIVIFLRPRDERWLVLVLFSYDTALWIASGLAQRTGGSAYVFHAVIWFFLPLAFHLHTILPHELFPARVRRSVQALLYGIAGVLAVLDALLLLQRVGNLSIWFTLAGVLVSVALLLLRLVLPLDPATKIAARIMTFGVTLGLLPFLLFHGVFLVWFKHMALAGRDMSSFSPYMTGIAAVSVPILPMAYVYSIYKHHLRTVEFRANRLLGVYTFSVLVFVSYAMVFFALSGRWPTVQIDFLAAVFLVSMLYVAATPVLHDRFQRWVDRHVFGIKHSAEEVIGLVSERIPTAFDREVLAGVIAEEILPALLIRQSALYLFAEDSEETLYEQAVPEGGREPAVEALRAMLAESGRYLPPGSPRGAAPPWVRLVLPLAIQAKTIGVWLIGRRDPDDYFPVSDIHLLSTVANQIAPMVENVRLYEKAQQEIEQRKAAEEAIRRSEERFRTLFEATLEGIAIVRNGVILEVNHAVLEIFGCRPEDVMGRRLSDLVAGEVDLAGVTRESIGFRRDGSAVDIEVAGKRYRFQGEEVSVVAIRDIAQRKQDETENKLLQRQLLHSAKMEAIGRLSAGVAHDFNNCLLAIFGYSDLLLERYSGDPFLCRNLTGLKEAGQRAAALTKQLLAFARRQPMETKVMNVNGIVSGLEKMLQRLLGEDIHLATELDPELGKVKIDPGQIEQVIVNLAVNARQAMPKGGRLILRTAPLLVTDEAPAPHADVPPGAYVLLTVTDTGLGMDAATQARVFEPFFSTKGEGTGLGLSTAYGIVRQSGGQIFVNSAPGEGACFSIYLPVTREAEILRGGVMSASSDRGSETILLVEDEDEVRTVLHQILVGKGYRVLQAGSGEEALVISRLHRGAVHLLLTDVTMPEMKGPELAQRLRAERPATQVVFMSGYNEERLSDGVAESPVCLQKPFSPQLLGETLRAVLDAAEGLQATG